jgi:hypothetical protein
MGRARYRRDGATYHRECQWPYLQRRTLGDITAAVKTDTLPITIQYDCIGVGSGVKAEINRLTKDENIMPEGVSFIPWDAGSKVLWPEKRVIEDDRDTPLRHGKTSRRTSRRKDGGSAASLREYAQGGY